MKYPRLAAKSLVLLVILISFAASALGVSLPRIFGDHMVLQQDAPVPVWGWANPGEAITISIDGQRQETTAENSGKWKVTLEPLLGGKPTQMFVESKTSKVTFDDVLLCSDAINNPVAVRYGWADNPVVNLYDGKGGLP